MPEIIKKSMNTPITTYKIDQSEKVENCLELDQRRKIYNKKALTTICLTKAPEIINTWHPECFTHASSGLCVTHSMTRTLILTKCSTNV